MGIGPVNIKTAGSVTAPSTLPLSLGATFSTLMRDGLPTSVVDAPNQAMALWANGVDPIRSTHEGFIYRVGLLAPSTAMTALPSGAQATALWDIDVVGNGASIYNPANDEHMVLGVYYIGFATTLGTVLPATGLTPPVGAHVRILIGATGDLTMDGVIDFINGENEGVSWNYQSGPSFAPIGDTVEIVSHPTTYQLNLRIKEYGTSGNGVPAWLASGTWTDTDLEASGVSGTAVGTQNTFKNGTDGSGTAPAAGSYKYVYQWYRKADNALSGASPISTAAVQGVAQNVDLTVMTASADATADFTRWSRTLTNQARFYRGDEIARAGTTDTDDKTDASLLAAPIIYNERKFRTYRAGHVPRYRVLEVHNGRVFGAGARLSADYTAGTVTTAASDTLTIAGGYPIAEWEGRTFIVDDTSEEYLIVSVDPSSSTITLDRDYQDAAGAGKGYTVKDDRDANAIGFSEVNLPHQWPAQNSVTGVTSRSGDGIIGLKSIWEVLLVFTRSAVWRMVGSSSASYALRRVGGASGLVAGNAIAEDDTALYWLAPDGIMRWSADGRPENLTKPRLLNGIVRGINGTIKRINNAHASLSHAVYDKEEKIIRFFVPLDDDIVPGHAIVYDTQSGAFSVDRLPNITSSGVMTGADGQDVVVLGTLTGEVLQADVSNSDGAYGFEPRTKATGGTERTWTDSAAAFPTAGNGLAGVPLWFWTTSGDLASAVIASNTATVLTFTHRLATAPVIGSQGYVGAIPAHFRSGKFHLGIPDEDHNISNLEIGFSPDTDGTAIVAVGADQAELAVPYIGTGKIDMTDTDGTVTISMNETGREHQFGVWAIEPGHDPHFQSIGLLVQARQKPRVGV